MKNLFNIISLSYYKNILKKIKLYLETDFFDMLNGLDTTRVDKSELFGNDKNFEYCNLHVPTFTSRVKSVLKTLISLDKNIYDFNFVDLGSGKGKVIILAHKMGFKKILGVEISTKLNEICKNNLRKLGLNNIKIIEQDATEMKVLPENSVFYFYNSFEKPILDKVLENIYQTLKQKKKTCYFVCIDLKSLVDFKKFQLDNKKFTLIYNDETKPNPFCIYKMNFKS